MKQVRVAPASAAGAEPKLQLRGRFLGFLVFLLVLLWRATLRIRLVGEENRRALDASDTPVLHALWHQRLALGILRHPWRGAITMASLSEDGAIIATFLKLWGFLTVRGSSSRGGATAIAELHEAIVARRARWAALTTDGPRGPARKSKPGIAWLATQLGAPVLPTGTASARPRFLRSWDRFLVPLPFSRCVVVFAPVVSRQEGEGDPEFLARIDEAIDAATAEADRLVGVANAPRFREKKETPPR